MSEVSSTLNRLIDVAERTLCCRQRGAPPDMDEIAADVLNLQPPVGVVLTEASELLVSALASTWGAPDAQRPLWMTAIAALLQLVRNDLSQVLEARRRTLEPESAYRTGGMPKPSTWSGG